MAKTRVLVHVQIGKTQPLTHHRQRRQVETADGTHTTFWSDFIDLLQRIHQRTTIFSNHDSNPFAQSPGTENLKFTVHRLLEPPEDATWQEVKTVAKHALLLRFSPATEIPSSRSAIWKRNLHLKPIMATSIGYEGFILSMKGIEQPMNWEILIKYLAFVD